MKEASAICRMKQTTHPALRHAMPARRRRTYQVPFGCLCHATAPNQTYLLQMGEHIRPQLPDEILPHGKAPQGSQADECQMGQVGDFIRVERQIPQELLRIQPRVGKDTYPARRQGGVFRRGKLNTWFFWRMQSKHVLYLLLEKSARCSFL